jgi:hypothetical protein
MQMANKYMGKKMFNIFSHQGNANQNYIEPGLIVHTCNPSYSLGKDRILSLKPAPTKCSTRHHFKNKK